MRRGTWRAEWAEWAGVHPGEPASHSTLDGMCASALDRGCISKEAPLVHEAAAQRLDNGRARTSDGPRWRGIDTLGSVCPVRCTRRSCLVRRHCRRHRTSSTVSIPVASPALVAGGDKPSSFGANNNREQTTRRIQDHERHPGCAAAPGRPVLARGPVVHEHRSRRA